MLATVKKSQVLILSVLFLFLLVLFIYSLETSNSYIIKSSENTIVDNIIYETCYVGYLSNGTNIDGRFGNFSNDIDSYCSGMGYSCQMQIINNTQIPPGGNWSLLNYTHYNYSISYVGKRVNYTKEFTC